MNNSRRRRLRLAIEKLRKDKPEIETARNILEDILSEEEDARDNIPESLQDSDRYQVCEESCDLLEQAIDVLGDEEDTDIEDVLNTLAQIDGVCAPD